MQRNAGTIILFLTFISLWSTSHLDAWWWQSPEFDGLVNYADKLDSLGLYYQAIESYEQALTLRASANKKAEVHHKIADIYFGKLKDYEQAFYCYMKATYLYPKYRHLDQIYYRLGQSGEQIGKYVDAARAFQDVIIKFPQSPLTIDTTKALAAVERCFKQNFPENVAVFGNETITKLEFDDKLNSIPPFYRAQFESAEGKLRFLNQLIEQRLLVKEAEALGIGNQDSIIAKINEARDRILVMAFMDQEIRGKTEVSEEEIKQYYQEHRDVEFKIERQIRARQIVVNTREEAEQILQELKQGAKFDSLAKEHSVDISAKQGGDLGFFAEGIRDSVFDAVAFNLEVGEISDIVEINEKYHIIKLEEDRPERIRELDDVRPQIENQLLRQKQQERYDNLLARLKEGAHVQIDSTYFQEPPVVEEEAVPDTVEFEILPEPLEEKEEEKEKEK